MPYFKCFTEAPLSKLTDNNKLILKTPDFGGDWIDLHAELSWYRVDFLVKPEQMRDWRVEIIGFMISTAHGSRSNLVLRSVPSFIMNDPKSIDRTLLMMMSTFWISLGRRGRYKFFFLCFLTWQDFGTKTILWEGDQVQWCPISRKW